MHFVSIYLIMIEDSQYLHKKISIFLEDHKLFFDCQFFPSCDEIFVGRIHYGNSFADTR